MRQEYIRIGNGFMLVYSITSRYSFQEIIKLQREILKVKGSMYLEMDKDYFPMVLVGNKCEWADHERKVTPEEGQALAREFGCRWLEVSAKKRINIDEAFHDLVRGIREHNKATWEAELAAMFPAAAIENSRLPLKPSAARRRRWFNTKKRPGSLELIEEGETERRLEAWFGK